MNEGGGLVGMPAARLAAFAGLSMSFAATLGFLGGAAPVVLRAHGAGLAAVGLLQLITLPLGLTFLWAGRLDRSSLPGLPHRLGWIAAAQGLGIALMLALSLGEGWPAAVLFALALATSVSFATTDISMEALVVETVAASSRPAVTTAKLAGASAGGLVGLGLLVALADRLGWQGSFLALAALDAVCLLPLVAYPERRLRLPEAAPPPRRRGPARALRMPRALLGRALVLGLYFGASAAVGSAYPLALADLGLSLADIGVLTGTLGPLINLAATLGTGALMAGAAGRAVPAERLIRLLTLGVAASGVLLALGAAERSGGLAAAGVVLGLVSASGLGVPVFNTLFRWAEGASAAADYAVLFGVGFLVAMPARVGGPALAGAVGWPAFFALATPLHVGALILLARMMERTTGRGAAALASGAA